MPEYLQQLATHSFVPFHGVCSAVKSKQTSQQSVEHKKRCMLKRKVHISGRLLLNIMKDLDINRFLDMCKYGNADL